MASPIDQQLRHALTASGFDGAAQEWLDGCCAAIRHDATAATYPAAFTEASRRVGRGRMRGGASLGLPTTGGDPAALSVTAGGYEVEVGGWRRSDLARALLTLALPGGRDPQLTALAVAYRHGDSDERCSVVRAIGLIDGALPNAPRDTPPMDLDPIQASGQDAAQWAMHDALRTNVLPLFDAATAANPFFSATVPELEFNKAVLKRVFMDLPLDAVLGLEGRASADLSRMLLNLAEEREVTLRAYPAEIWPVVAGHPTPGLAAKLIGLIEHPDDQLRRTAARGLARLAAPHTRRFLEDRATREPQEAVRAALSLAIAAVDAGAR